VRARGAGGGDVQSAPPSSATHTSHTHMACLTGLHDAPCHRSAIHLHPDHFARHVAAVAVNHQVLIHPDALRSHHHHVRIEHRHLGHDATQLQGRHHGRVRLRGCCGAVGAGVAPCTWHRSTHRLHRVPLCGTHHHATTQVPRSHAPVQHHTQGHWAHSAIMLTTPCLTPGPGSGHPTPLTHLSATPTMSPAPAAGTLLWYTSTDATSATTPRGDTTTCMPTLRVPVAIRPATTAPAAPLT
jgi:hypothetical protein